MLSLLILYKVIKYAVVCNGHCMKYIKEEDGNIGNLLAIVILTMRLYTAEC